MLSRRGFLGALLGTAVLDPKRLLWIPGKKLISIPRPRVRVYSNAACIAAQIELIRPKLAGLFVMSEHLARRIDLVADQDRIGAARI
jgi:hypothetical protein